MYKRLKRRIKDLPISFPRWGDEGNIQKEEEEKVLSYLKNPTREGIWVLKAKWEGLEGISKEIKEDLMKILKNKDSIEIGEGKNRKKINLKKQEKASLITKVTKLSFIFELFRNFYHLEKGDKTLGTYLEAEESEYKLIFDLIDMVKLKSKYLEAFKFFEEDIFFEEFNSSVYSNRILRVKNGFFIYLDVFEEESRDFMVEEESRDFMVEDFAEIKFSKKIYLTSLNPEPLESLKEFYGKLGKITNCSLIKVHSPEEEIFAPYFALLEGSYEIFVEENNIQNRLRTSISEYNSNNFSYCISNIGIIAEEYLVQVYETLFLEPCSKKMSLGEIYKSIISKTTSKEKEIKLPEMEKIFSKLKEMEKNKKSGESIELDLLKQIRNALELIKEGNKYFSSKLESIKKEKIIPSIFPKEIRENIDELIENRNKISHRSKGKIGDYEALRSVYCVITLILWWENEKKKINWKEHMEDIIKDFINRNN